MDESRTHRRGEARQFWSEAVRLWEESGLAVREFCRREGLEEHSLHAWRRRLPCESSPRKIPTRVPLRRAHASAVLASVARRRSPPAASPPLAASLTDFPSRRSPPSDQSCPTCSAGRLHPLERIMREIRRRTRVVGAFPDGRSALMLVVVRLRHIAGTRWGTRRYLDMQ